MVEGSRFPAALLFRKEIVIVKILLSAKLSRLFSNKHLKIGTLFITAIMVSLYLLAVTLTSSPGTYAWFTSQTQASGSIQNATTSDLLEIHTSEIVYGENCSVSNSLSIKNISNMDTVVKIYLISQSGEKSIVEKRLKPEETVESDPAKVTDRSADCEKEEIVYRVQAFNNFINETHKVMIDREQLKATIQVQEKDGPVKKGSETETAENIPAEATKEDSALNEENSEVEEEITEEATKEDSVTKEGDLDSNNETEENDQEQNKEEEPKLPEKEEPIKDEDTEDDKEEAGDKGIDTATDSLGVKIQVTSPTPGSAP
jgi:hypothetical protein